MILSTCNTSQVPTNPFNQLILDCQNNPKEIQARYETHRSTRNAQFKEKLLHPEFPGWQVDEILRKLLANASPNQAGTVNPFSDHRHNLNLYARPPKHIKELVAEVQREIRDVAPTLWFSPPESLHITTLEIVSSRTSGEINTLASHLQSSDSDSGNSTGSKLVNFTSSHRTRLVKPILSFDASAMALSFLPAAGEPTNSTSEHDDAYTYHHVRQDLADEVLGSGVSLGARYVVPSAHVTVARFVSQEGFLLDGGDKGESADRESVARLVERIERVNGMLRERYWPKEENGTMPVKGEWLVGQEEGLELNKGASWYGVGEKVLVGRGFDESYN